MKNLNHHALCSEVLKLRAPRSVLYSSHIFKFISCDFILNLETILLYFNPHGTRREKSCFPSMKVPTRQAW